MKALVIGSGGREHALAWKISRSELVKELYCAPGNAGMAQIAHCLPIQPSEIDKLADFASQEGIDLTVVGPELPLALGIVDEFQRRGLKILGPTKEAARLEASKVFAKELMKEHGIPTAEFAIFTSPTEAHNYIKRRGLPIVIKADGLAAGKGTMVARTLDEAQKAVSAALIEKRFGAAGERIIVEDFLEGEEASFIALVDKDFILPLAPSQDHKPLRDGDKGPNTGGMGAYSPAPVITLEMNQRIIREVIEPTIEALRARGTIYRGVIYAGLMIVKGEPFVLEFNVRFGDPETQPIVMRLKDDIIPILLAVTEDNLGRSRIEWDERSSVCVVMASKGYPEAYEKGKPILGLDEASRMPQVQIFHAGTRRTEAGIVTDGGRVLGVTSLGHGLKEAIERAYSAVSKISWDGAYYRKDIGWRGLDRG